MTHSLEISETSVLSPQVPCPAILSGGETLILLQGHSHSCLTLHSSLCWYCPPQPPCLTHHNFPFRIQLRHHHLQEDFWEFPKHWGDLHQDRAEGRGRGLGDPLLTDLGFSHQGAVPLLAHEPV